MPPFHVVLGAAAGLVSAAGFVPYILAIVRRQARPSVATWFIWTGVGTVLFASYWAAGARASVWVAASYMLGPLVTALFAARHGERGFSRFEKACLLGAALSIGLWVVTGNPLVALGLNIFIDLLGALPTYRNAWRDPSAENKLAWGLFFAGNTLNLGAVESLSFSAAGYPIYLFLMSLGMIALLHRPQTPRS